MEAEMVYRGDVHNGDKGTRFIEERISWMKRSCSVNRIGRSRRNSGASVCLVYDDAGTNPTHSASFLGSASDFAPTRVLQC
jgi:hypothetical protein